MSPREDTLGERLLRLQAIDSELDALRRKRETLAERAAAKAAQRRLAEATAEHNSATARLEELAKAQGALSAQAETLTARAAGLQQRLFGPQAAGVRDLASINHELETTKAHLGAVEDELLGLMEQAEEAEGAIGRAEAARVVAAGEAEHAAKELAAAEAILDGEALVRIKDRREFATGVDGPILDRYEKLRKRLGGVAVASLDGRRCGGCHLELAATELDHLRHGHPGDLPTCEACDRLLVVD